MFPDDPAPARADAPLDRFPRPPPRMACSRHAGVLGTPYRLPLADSAPAGTP